MVGLLKLYAPLNSESCLTSDRLAQSDLSANLLPGEFYLIQNIGCHLAWRNFVVKITALSTKAWPNYGCNNKQKVHSSM